MAVTPMMKQYYEIKAKHPDAILLFRVGDFYEMYGDDAVAGAAILGIVQTYRNSTTMHDLAMAGFPHHALETYLTKFIRAGKRVAICDQLEDPKMAKTLVKRGITELVTPGVSTSDAVLNQKENNFLASVHCDKAGYGIAFLDISTGEFFTAEGDADYVDKLLANFAPKEVLIERSRRREFEERFGSRYLTFEAEDWMFSGDSGKERLQKHFETQSLKGFGVHHLRMGIVAAGAILHYLDLTQHTRVGHITSLARIEPDLYMRLDKSTVRSLEIVQPLHEEGTSLLSAIDCTVSPMGARMLRRWLIFPLKDVKAINERQDAVEYFSKQPEIAAGIDEHIARMGDLERLISKASVGRMSPREMVQLKVALMAIEPVRQACLQSDDAGLRTMGSQMDPCLTICNRIAHEIHPDPPAILARGNVIAKGINSDLDHLRYIAFSGKDYLMQIQERESKRTDIPSLKVAYNNVFGYYIEVRNTHISKVPSDWIRKQTLVNGERYITAELKEYEEQILGAEEKIIALETTLYNGLMQALTEYIPQIQKNASLISSLDCLLSMAKVAAANRYVRPTIDETDVVEIKAGRHPVIEKTLPPGESYVPNDVYLDQRRQQIIIITGPNMAGKSALLRQTALIVLLAQTGSFVPANSARIGIVDKIFTRVGASDNISQGESTFMVEMNEASGILNNLSARSLILFDELGRGTSTYDGISIAWAIVEYIHESTAYRPKTLFATHYHELNEMERSFKRIKNFNVSVKDTGRKVVFLRKLVRGGSEHSFGIHVARMAGMPKSIVKRADEILMQLEASNKRDSSSGSPAKGAAHNGEGYQLNFFQLDDPILSRLRDEINSLDLNSLTPIAALNRLYDIKKILTGGK
ncbi:MAG: DNA mismatch repair protein MutS [Tannerellaceae bacterium]|jgi:DNA mismatch repair protein MutS|nr:DNA mismatch repair protein MutS [Tannerellaceae bacterium]